MSLRIIPFDDAMLPEAGALLAIRQRRIRSTQPELPARFEEPATAAAAVEALWRHGEASGVAAVRGGRLHGYLIGERVIDTLWGRSAWVRFAGCALHPEEDVETVRDLYAALAAPWVASGCFAHHVLMPAADPALVDRWFALCFGIEQIDGLTSLVEAPPTSAPSDRVPGRPYAPCPDPPGVEIRLAGPEDRSFLEELSDVIWRHQVKAPCWGIHLPEWEAVQRRNWGDLVDEPHVRIFLALSEGQAIGIQGYGPADTGPEHCAELIIAGTREAARGRGIGQALTRHVFAHASAAGYRACLTDWRSTNLTSSRFWPRQGFRPVAYRLARRVDDRIAWGGERRR